MPSHDHDLEREISLQELEPSPVEDTPLETRDSYFTSKDEPSPSPRQRTSTFGLASHSVPWYLNRVQKYSSYTFTVFAAFHITNTSLIPLITQSVPASEPYLLLTRPYYQSPIAEPLIIILPVIAHISSGLALRIYRRHQALKNYGAETPSDRRSIPWPKVTGTSKLGYLFLPLLAGHYFINRVIPLKEHGGSSSVNLSYVSHAFAKHPAVAFTGFSALVGVGVWHFTWGWSQWMGWLPQQVGQGGEEGRIRRKKRWYLINGASAVVTMVWLAGALGVIGRGGEARGWLGREYDELNRSIPIVGKWLC